MPSSPTGVWHGGSDELKPEIPIVDFNCHHTRSKGELRMSVVTPNIARGLEFDGVVVVEPELFPKNLARLGSLYTSLVRANTELAVVHSQGLPNELRQASRR